jgi:hypothetical protein
MLPDAMLLFFLFLAIFLCRIFEPKIWADRRLIKGSNLIYKIGTLKIFLPKCLHGSGIMSIFATSNKAQQESDGVPESP